MEVTEINGCEIAYIRRTGKLRGIGLLMQDMVLKKHDEKSTVVTFTYRGNTVYLRETNTDYTLACRESNAYEVMKDLEARLKTGKAA